MAKSKILSFFKEWEYVVRGESDKATSERAWRGQVACLESQIPMEKGVLLRLEIKLDEAKDKFRKSKVNFGEIIKTDEDETAYIDGIYTAKKELNEVEEKMAKYTEKMNILIEVLAELSEEVENDEQ